LGVTRWILAGYANRRRRPGAGLDETLKKFQRICDEQELTRPITERKDAAVRSHVANVRELSGPTRPAPLERDVLLHVTKLDGLIDVNTGQTEVHIEPTDYAFWSKGCQPWERLTDR
jgi:hypothetical protein